MQIENSYLMWIGSEHYENLDEYTDEVKSMGVSKRLPGIGMANAMSQPNTVVFVAHDNGETEPCDACLGEVVCPDCRVRDGKIKNHQDRIDAIMRHFKGEVLPRGKQRTVDICSDKIKKLIAEKKVCETCDGQGVYEDGTGGYVVKSGGEKMDYRSYNYWMRQPGKFDAKSEVMGKYMCEECGGTGKIPQTKIFGVFIPTDVEYILSGRETEVVLREVEKFKLVEMTVVADEVERGCGKRHPGYYVVTRKTGPTKEYTKKVVEELSKKGVIEGAVEMIGDFVRFVKPVEISGVRRFRGVKKFNLVPEAEEQAEMVLDAIE
jgi:hypothetical protein